MKKTVIIALISLVVLITTSVIVYHTFFYHSGMTGINWDGRILDKMDAESRMGYFASGLQLEGDYSVLPSSDYPALDSIVSVMKYYACDSFQYIVQLHSHHPQRNEPDVQADAQAIAESFVRYFINAGIAPKLLTAKGTVGKEHFYVHSEEPLDWSRPQKQLEIDVELPPLKR